MLCFIRNNKTKVKGGHVLFLKFELLVFVSFPNAYDLAFCMKRISIFGDSLYA